MDTKNAARDRAGVIVTLKHRDPSRSDYIEPPEPVMLSRVGAQAYL